MAKTVGGVHTHTSNFRKIEEGKKAFICDIKIFIKMTDY